MSTEPSINDSRYNRQIYLLGVDGMKKIASSSVLISGLGGLGVEIAKNIILAGIKSVTIHDTRNCQCSDLASNFYLKESDFGKNRASCCYEKLKNLNSSVTVTCMTDELTNDFLSHYNFVVITDYYPDSEIRRISSFCHENNIKLIFAETSGVFAYLFNDFGHNFCTTDIDGEPTQRFLISYIENGVNPAVFIDENEVFEIGDTDSIIFDGVNGMTEINGKEFEVEVITKYNLRIKCDTTNYGKYDTRQCGYATKVKKSLKIDFLQFSDAIKNTDCKADMTFDFCTFGRDRQIILAFQAYHQLLDKNPQDPKVNGNDLIAKAKEINSSLNIVDEIDEPLLKEFARESSWIISPTCATLGGIVGHEILIGVMGKFTPVNQFLAIGSIESISSNSEDLHFTENNDRYDPYRAIFGDKHQEKMMSLKYFLVGAGALGCEQIKNMALMGIGNKNNKGMITIADMDTIEKSNLNRQFLFTEDDVNNHEHKSVAAAKAAKEINPQITIVSKKEPLCEETTATYNDFFYTNLDGVCDALDNFQARRYSSDMCLLYKKPLIDTGTEGAKAHLYTVVPNLTQGLEAPQNEQTTPSIPACTLHNFPTRIQHCCAWATDKFYGLFDKQPTFVKDILKPEAGKEDFLKIIQNMRRSDLLKWKEVKKSILDLLKDGKCETFEDCVRWARNLFEDLFNFRIRDIQHQYPKDFKAEGVDFWVGDKIFPDIQLYDPKNHYHAEFITSTSLIRARICNINTENINKENAAEIAAKFEVPEWKSSLDIISSKDDGNEQFALFDDDNDQTMDEFASLLSANNKLEIKPEAFDKDGDENGHVDFVDSASNIRALNYHITTASKLDIKRIAGHLIPAISTTTAMICGLAAFEMYKLHCPEEKKIDCYRGCNINLAAKYFMFTEPLHYEENICESNGLKFSIWTTWEIVGFITLRQLVDSIIKDYKLIPKQIEFRKKPLYEYSKVDDERMDKQMKDILEREYGITNKSRKFMIPMTVICKDLSGNDVNQELPKFVLVLKLKK
ncbi:hypothetical protein M9Y10_008889 [Tritrichomonas musculus]|uniref:Ubiquitin-activating enzyme E1 C-terminal domain-containing protein n=1 Tax=Tritrichomonas musculus TaxID=1915356 RepID=A0ABR2IZC8_9EUKA